MHALGRTELLIDGGKPDVSVICVRAGFKVNAQLQ